MKKIRGQIYNLLNLKAGNISYVIDYFLLGLILLNCFAIILESIPNLRSDYARVFQFIEILSVYIFSIEYILRIWISVDDPYFKTKFPRLKFFFSIGAVIDLLAILPFYLQYFTVDLRFIRIFRLLRLLRLLKIARYLQALDIIVTVFRNRKSHLLITFILLVFMLIISSTIIYYIENLAQPKKFSSIPETMWWGIATLTTIGYGDMYPITAIGKTFGSIISLIGIGLFALPTGIIASGFSEELAKRENKEAIKCINCGHEIK